MGVPCTIFPSVLQVEKLYQNKIILNNSDSKDLISVVNIYGAWTLCEFTFC